MNFIRSAVIGAICAALLSPAAFACDLKTSTHAFKAADYVDGVRRCLRYLPSEFAYDETIEQDNLARVNMARVEAGLPRLQLRKDLRAAARWHSLDMAANQFVGHIGADGRWPQDRISLLDRTLLTDKAGENIAMMRGFLERRDVNGDLHQGLMDSPSHRENILADYYTHMAVGVVRYKDGVWLTQVFANEAGELSEPVPLRLAPGQSFMPEADIKGWTFENFGAFQDSKLTPFKIEEYSTKPIVPAELQGDILIRVRADRHPPDGLGQVFYINLPGPKSTILPAASPSKVSATTTETTQLSPEAS